VTREITIETTERLSFLQSAQGAPAWCTNCARQTHFLPLIDALALLGVESAVLHRWIKEGKLHLETSSQGLLAVCENSLSLMRVGEHESET
jgi:hypothetical protein